MSWEVARGDCLEVLRELPDACVDAIVTDPPAGIGFMGKGWDKDKGGRDAWVAWLRTIMVECLRVLQPGGHALVWALPRTSHWTATAIEEAGFEIRDRVSHVFGTGFPKSLNLGDGRGTALKPACEDWWLCRKPLDGTVASCVAAHGTGALNVDACRIGTQVETWPSSRSPGLFETTGGGMKGPTEKTPPPPGRWPANLVLDEAAAELLDAQSGETGCHSRSAKAPRKRGTTGAALAPDQGRLRSDRGGASRFFYVAKPSSAERDLGLESIPARSGGEATGREDGSDGLRSPRAGAGRGGGRKNVHPTVKAIALMRWLCRLIAPPGGLVLDPFCGSGSTGCAAVLEGLEFLGIEREEEYAEIAELRIAAAAKARP